MPSMLANTGKYATVSNTLKSAPGSMIELIVQPLSSISTKSVSPYSKVATIVPPALSSKTANIWLSIIYHGSISSASRASINSNLPPSFMTNWICSKLSVKRSISIARPPFSIGLACKIVPSSIRESPMTPDSSNSSINVYSESSSVWNEYEIHILSNG